MGKAKVASVNGHTRIALEAGEEMLTAFEAAALLGCKKRRSTVYRLTSSGALPAYRLGTRSLRWRKADIEAFLGKSRTTAVG